MNSINSTLFLNNYMKLLEKENKKKDKKKLPLDKIFVIPKNKKTK